MYGQNLGPMHTWPLTLGGFDVVENLNFITFIVNFKIRGFCRQTPPTQAGD